MDYGSPKTLLNKKYQSELGLLYRIISVIVLPVHTLYIHCTYIYVGGHSCTKMLLFSLSLSLHSYRRDHPFTDVASHPSKLCIATGNRRGEIQLW